MILFLSEEDDNLRIAETGLYIQTFRQLCMQPYGVNAAIHFLYYYPYQRNPITQLQSCRKYKNDHILLKCKDVSYSAI